jgi:transcriptional antiterminator NusG
METNSLTETNGHDSAFLDADQLRLDGDELEPAVETAGEGVEEDEELEEPNRRWFVIHTYSGYENKVKTNLEHRIESMGVGDKIYDVVIPTEEEVEIKDGQRRTVQRKVFPGYVLVQMLVTD